MRLIGGTISDLRFQDLGVCAMDRETLVEAIKNGPVRIFMNDGRQFDIPSSEFAVVSSLTAYVLTKTDDGKYRGNILSLVCMTGVEELETA